jgi:hypothetical protein
VEDYCRVILVLFHPFRNLADITIEGSYHKRFMQVFPRGVVPATALQILGNVQMYYDTLRLPARDDPITSCTKPFHAPGEMSCPDLSETEDEEESDDFTDLFGLLTPTPPPTLLCQDPLACNCP